jgi:hypothetical protein
MSDKNAIKTQPNKTAELNRQLAHLLRVGYNDSQSDQKPLKTDEHRPHEGHHVVRDSLWTNYDEFA